MNAATQYKIHRTEKEKKKKKYEKKHTKKQNISTQKKEIGTTRQKNENFNKKKKISSNSKETILFFCPLFFSKFIHQSTKNKIKFNFKTKKKSE